jgi:hypothetical protein
MKTYLLMAEHQTTPGIVVKVFANYALALCEALELANIMLKDAGLGTVSDKNSMYAAIEYLQDEHGAAHCYVDITEHDVIER